MFEVYCEFCYVWDMLFFDDEGYKRIIVCWYKVGLVLVEKIDWVECECECDIEVVEEDCCS